MRNIHQGGYLRIEGSGCSECRMDRSIINPSQANGWCTYNVSKQIIISPSSAEDLFRLWKMNILLIIRKFIRSFHIRWLTLYPKSEPGHEISHTVSLFIWSWVPLSQEFRLLDPETWWCLSTSALNHSVGNLIIHI